MKHRSNERGAAGIEAVIALPVLLIIFLGLVFVRDRAIAKQQAEQQARSCAWLYSAQDCEGSVPPGCEGVVLARADAPNMAPPQLTQALSDQLGRVKGGQGVKGGDLVTGLIGPTVGNALEAAFGNAIDATTSRPVARSPLFGPGQQTVAGKYHIACNLHPTTLDEVAQDAWNKITPW